MTPETSDISLSGDCSIRTIVDLHATLQDGFRQGGAKVVVDVAAVEDVDVTFIQLMVSGAKTAAATGRGFGLVNVPAPVAACFTQAGRDVTRLLAPA